MYISKVSIKQHYISVIEAWEKIGYMMGNYILIENDIIFNFSSENEYKVLHALSKANDINYQVLSLKGLEEEILDEYLHLREA